MADRIRADVERLEEYSDRTLDSFGAVEDAVEAYQQARSAYLDAPSDLSGTWVDDRSPEVAGTLLELQSLDVLPRAFAGALRTLDDRGGPVRGAPDDTRFEDLVAAQVAPPGQQPGAHDLDVPDGYLSGAWRNVDEMFVPDSDDVEDPLWWFGNAPGLPLSTAQKIDQHLVQRVSGYTTTAGTVVDDYVRWQAGTARVMNRVASASTINRVANSRLVQGATKAAPFALAGVGQVIEDWDDEDLTAGDRVARTGAAVALEGGGAWAGAALGAKGGAAAGAVIGSVLPGPGTAVGAAVGGVVGGVVGGIAGSELGGWIEDQGSEVIESAGDVIDGGIDMAGDALGTAGDALGGLAEGPGDLVGSIF